MVLNKATWAKKYNVSRAAVTMAVKSGALVENLDGMLDDKNKKNQEWVARRSGQRPAEKAKAKSEPEEEKKTQAQAVKIKPKQEEQPKLENIPEESHDDKNSADYEDDLSYDDMGALSIAKVRAEIRFKHEQADAALQKRLERLGLLVDRELVRKAFAKLAQEIKTRFIELPQRAAPALVAIIKAGRPDSEVQKYLEVEISRSVEDIKASMSEF